MYAYRGLTSITKKTEIRWRVTAGVHGEHRQVTVTGCSIRFYDGGDGLDRQPVTPPVSPGQRTSQSLTQRGLEGVGFDVDAAVVEGSRCAVVSVDDHGGEQEPQHRVQSLAIPAFGQLFPGCPRARSDQT